MVWLSSADVAVHAVGRCANLQLALDRDLKIVPQGGRSS